MAKHNISQQINVSMSDIHYPILMTRSGLTEPGLLKNYISSKQVLIVTNETIAPLYLHQVQAACADLQCDVVILKDGEQYKNQASLNLIYDQLIEKRHHRDTTLIALGGGVVGDITGFAAATYQRGVAYIQIPTSLLAQVDASIGGKTAINHPSGKNMIGCFYQPRLVLIDLKTLQSLPEREFNAGLAEVIKYALLTGGEFLDYLSKALEEGLTVKNTDTLMPIIAECCKIKADIVARDEKETGPRALLNLGHTFAHALEAQTKYRRFLHGEAVGIGLYCAALLSYQLGHIDFQFVQLLESMLINANLPYKIPRDIHLTELRDMMSLDKKIKSNRIRFVLIKNPCACFLDSEVSEAQLHQTLMDAVEGEEYDRGKEPA